MWGIRYAALLLMQAVMALACALAAQSFFDEPWAQGWVAVAFGLWLGALLWLGWDNRQAMRMARWLKAANLAQSPVLGGVWGMMALDTRRWLRTQEQAARQAQQRLQDILSALQASPNGLVLLERDRIEWCNLTAQQFFGLDLPRDLQQSIGNLVRDPAFIAYWQARSFVQPLCMNGRGHTDMKPLRLSVQFHPYDHDRHLLLARDITALEQAEEMRRDFVANVSHEIRTPLTVLTGFIETLQNLHLDETQRQHYLSLMQQQTVRMTSLVKDLLALSRLEGTPAPGFDQWVSVQALLQVCQADGRALEELLRRESSPSCGDAVQLGADVAIPGDPTPLSRLHFPPPDDPTLGWEIAGVQAELLGAITNLIHNALRHTPLTAQVHVQWQLLPDNIGGGARLSVRDTGAGIAKNHLARLTERFYRVDTSRSRDTGGTGLGLAIVKHALQRHGARLVIESSLGEGATFSAVFPASRLRRGGTASDNAQTP